MFRDLLVSVWKPYGTLSELQLSILERHYMRLMDWNKSMNLTRVRDIREFVELHYCESMFLASVLPAGPLTIVDVGSGAGFPGIPLAVVRPECRITLVESNARKCVFLRESCRELRNTTVFTGRVESISNRYDWLVSRAVALPEILRLRVAPRVAILMIPSDLPRDVAPLSLIHLPWGSQRVVATFHVEQD